MKTIFQKDLRENLKIALIGLLLFSLLLLEVYHSCAGSVANTLRDIGSNYDDMLQPLLSSSLRSEAAFFLAIFGAALGWLQTRNEAHRDLWAFLIHRPVTRTEIFRGKALAGLCLYFFGAGLPLAIFIAVVRMPGHIAAPFEWEMTLPLAAIFLTGVVYYFAGMLTGLRQARWFASRSFGLGVAIITSLGVLVPQPFWQSLLLIAVAVAITATAAWGAYQTGGFYRGLRGKGKLALIVAMTVGCATVLFVGAGLVFMLILSPLSPPGWSYAYYQMTRDGTVCKINYRNGEITDIATLDGKPLISPKTGRKMEQKEFQEFTSYGGTAQTTLNQPDRDQARDYFLASLSWDIERFVFRVLFWRNQSSFFHLWNVTDKTLWYLDRHGALIGYDGRTRRCIGQLEAPSQNGRAPELFLPSPERYRYYNSYDDTPQKLLPTAKAVYRVDFKARTAQPVFTLTNDDEIGGYALQGITSDRLGEHRIFITTRKIVSLVNDSGAVFTAPYQPSFGDYPMVQLQFLEKKRGETNSRADHYAVWFIPDYQKNFKSGYVMPEHIAWLDSDRGIIKTIDLPTLRGPKQKNLADQAVTSLLPPLVLAGEDKSLFGAWHLLSWAWAGISAVIAWTLARRYHFSNGARIGWTLFVFLLGLAGLLTFLCVQEWPAREACPNCKKLRCVDREDCEHCAATFSPPEKNGTEIFAEPVV
jgi:hypothetical protein